MKRVKIISNPSSGRQSMDRRLERLIKLLIDNGYTVNKYETEKKDDATNETIKAASEDWDLIVVSGGDGTVNEVAKGIMLAERKIPVAIYASGTVNDFANYMNIPSDPNQFFEMIERYETLDVDLGKFNDNYFVNVAAGGLLTNIGYQVQPEAKMVLGRMAYYLEGVKEFTLQNLESIHLKIESEEYSGEEDILLFIISNSSSIGGFKKLAPSADVLDGLLDVVIIKKSGLQDAASIFFNIFKGDHVNHPNVIYFKSNKIVLESNDEGITIDVDGEYGGKLPGVFEAVPNAFRILI